ncbi:MAG: LacI family DNA-binding transcriptional regulator [Lachnospiraceae bacterium]|nr:LacI family DNA-binding transcriptional regulator [Lachnospiraceae bacterium]
MITTSELAAIAGVSQSTVSRALSDHPSISFETKERIRRIALQYGYVLQKKGRRTYLTDEHKVIGVLVEDRPFFDDLFINYAIGRLISSAASRNYYTIRLPISSLETGSMERLRDFLSANLIDGFVIMHRVFDRKIHEYLSELGIPHVYLLHCSRDSVEDVDMVDTDNYTGGYLAAQHLTSRGHRRILTLTCPWREFEDRTAGFLQGLAAAGLSPDRGSVIRCECSFGSAFEAVSRNIAMFEKASAVYVQSDIMAAGVISAIHSRGLDIPGDISVIGSDGYDLGLITSPQFDSVAHPIDELTDLAVSRLIECIGSAHPRSPRQIKLRPYIVERGSVRRIGE